ncbi:GNAT family N-acetyltransferase [Psychroflexus sp. CAK1W]|uniref:GNAT family N-acetyltransferase n=1 Tax=Psychroflexus curvus TaxID=2873595 RepID=UPI001CCAD19A|nr:GNAT family N-acetyltransferase [Psychroflexus curvus]MBZ9626596.1 GNAT family N-acetyltransferase [Psychroflexus curvus]
MEIVIADSSHAGYANIICNTIEEASQIRGTGIAKRDPNYIISKLENGNAVIALDGEKFAGFCYIEVWSHEKFVANSGLIVHPDYRSMGLAKKIKAKVFAHSRKKYPEAKIFSITTGLAVMKMNSELGYHPVTFSELTDDESFWNGCQSCKNYDVLQSKNRKMCFCTGMIYDPHAKHTRKKQAFNPKNWERLKKLKHSLFFKKNNK